MRLEQVNVISMISLGSMAIHLEKGLTIILLITAIVLNIKKFFERDDK